MQAKRYASHHGDRHIAGCKKGHGLFYTGRSEEYHPYISTCVFGTWLNGNPKDIQIMGDHG